MANIYALFGTDDAAETKGVWVEFGEGFAIKLARAGGKNKSFSKALERASRPHRRTLQTGTAAEGLAERLMIDAYAKTVVMDWKNITDKDGSQLPFTAENCVKLFTDLPDLFKYVVEEADKVANFQQDSLEEDEKNSPASCSTT